MTMKRILSLLSLCLLAPAAFATPSFFAPATNDQSMYYLAAIFGNVGNVLSQWTGAHESTLLKYTFLYFNNAVIVLGCILILYTLVISTINTSHDGEMMGKRFNSVWIPLRSALGFALLLPTTTSSLGMGNIAVQGYAVIQVFVMWVIVQGVGAADYIWSNMVDQIATGNAQITMNTSTTSDLETATSIFEYMTCTIGLMESQTSQNYYTQQDTNNAQGPKSARVTWGSDTFIKYGYRQTAPNVMYQKTDGSSNTPYSYVWAFGFGGTSDWTRQSVCGYVMMPTGEGSGDPAKVAYYTRQAALINEMIGYDSTVAAKDQYYKGIYGGPWYGIYPTDGKTLGDPGAEGVNHTPDFMVTNADKTKTQIPTLGYLADAYMVFLDTGSPKPAPGGTTGSLTGICYDSNDTVVPCPDTATSDAQTYVTTQLQNMAEAYQAQTIANYQQYQDEEAAQNAGQGGDEGIASDQQGETQCQTDENGVTQCSIIGGNPPIAPDQQGKTQCQTDENGVTQCSIIGGNSTPPPVVTGTLTPAERKDVLVSAAKYNGWASAGAFFLDMARALGSSTSTLSASTYDYSYPGLACQNGVGITSENQSGRSCQDARTATDIQGIFRGGKTDGKNKKMHRAYGYGVNNLSLVLVGAEGISMQVLGNSYNEPETEPGTDKKGSDCTPLTDSNGAEVVDSSGKPVETCGIYNSATNGNPAFDTRNFTKPRFPAMIISPIAWFKYVNQSIMWNFAQTLQPIMSMGTTGQLVNPLFTLRQAGIRLLNTSSKLYHVGFKYMWVSGLVSYVASGWTGIANAMTSALTWGMAMYSVIISMMMTMGAILAYYFPMIPYLIFTFAFIQWLVLTVEAMAAAPLLSLGILNPEGEHEVFGKSSMGIAILASVFLRPPLMIIGYFAATVMSYVTVMIVNGGFFFAANSLLGGLGADGGAASMFGTLIIWGMYVNTLMVVLNKSFTLIYHLADHVTRWIGITEGHSSDIEKMMGDVKGGVEQGAKTAKDAGDAQAKARKQSMQNYADAANEGKEILQKGAKASAGMPPTEGM